MTKIATIQPAAQPFDSGAHHHGPDNVQLGQWYWVTDTVEWDGQWHHATDENHTRRDLKKGEKVTWLGCVMQIGSNFVELESPPIDRSSSSRRIHFDDFDECLKYADDAEEHIAERQAFFKQKINGLLTEVREATAKLGIVPTEQIADQIGEGQNALVVVSAQPDTTAYKNALVKASKESLPALFKEIKEANKELARWMVAPTLPLQAGIGPMENTIGAIKDRIYTIELYAGLTEEAVKVHDGAPAQMDEKLHIMQRRLYMDEECLADYTAGGMEFKDIKKFDAWISKPKNRDRLLPFPRTLAAFRVRRDTKDREDDGNVWRMFVNFQLSDADQKTFLYVRNGEQVWRINCDFEFDEMIVPNKEQFDPSVPMMVKMFAGSIDKIMPRKRWESLCETHKKHEAWMKKWNGKPKEKGCVYYSGDSPYYREVYGFEPDRWKPFDQTNVYFDEAMKEIGAQIKRYNRIAVIVQGLFDRSEVLHPHRPVRIWEPGGFDAAIKLIYDAVTLTHGEKPDFEAFRAKLNASLNADSIVTGQEDFWMRREAVKENEKISRNYNYRGTPPNYTRYKPYGDSGPGLVGPMDGWKAKARKASFRWTRDSRTYRRFQEVVGASIEVPASALLNVTAYKPGDFKRFFADPRTRREYLKWAPLMLVAEDYHAGKLDPKKNRSPSDTRDW